jgi:hypothetical protein
MIFQAVRCIGVSLQVWTVVYSKGKHGVRPRVFPPLHQGLVGGTGGVASMENIPEGKKLSHEREGASITASATLHPLSLAHCPPRRTEGSRRDLN